MTASVRLLVRPVVLAFVSAALLASPGCNGRDDEPRVETPMFDEVRPVDVSQGGWTVDAEGWASLTAAELGEKLGGCAVGDVDADSPGNEIVAVSESGRVFLVSYADGKWTHRVLGQAPGEMIQVALGELDPARPGLEVVAVGMAQGKEDDGGEGAAFVFFRDGDGWTMREAARASELLHGVAIADLDPDHPGNELLVDGFSGQATVLALGANGFERVVTVPLPGAGKMAVPHQDGVAIACADGSVSLVRREAPGKWTATNIARQPAGAARVASDDERLLVARDDGTLELVSGSLGKIIHRETERLRGAVLANVDPVAPGLEAASAGYEGKVWVMTNEDLRWHEHEVYADGNKLHHLAAGELTSVGSGVFLVTCGYSGRVVVITKKRELAAVETPEEDG
ncbi:MAG: hypothetical protein H6825_00620 [Planctomycetes bacterium]|nr:hypothetical protein [Planctomycetota bacterium]